MNIPEKVVGILGLTHLGCVLSACWSKLGLKTIGIDLDQMVVENLQNSIPPIFEPGLESEIRNNLQRGLLRFSTDISTVSCCDFVFFGYDTEVDDQDVPDTSYLEERIHEIGPLLKDNALVIVSSQTPVGICRRFRSILQRYNPSLELVYSPENLQLGMAIQCYLHPERIILGAASKHALERSLELFHIITQNILAMSLESAEIVKHGINAFLAASIVFANQLADVSEHYPEANMADVIQGIKSDARIGPKAYLSPGIGFSGGTLGRDVAVLGQILEQDGGVSLFDFIHSKNMERKLSIVKKIKHILSSLEHRTVGVLGLTYKPGTSTLRRSLPLEIVTALLAEGAKVQVFDPKADYSSLKDPAPFLKAHSIEGAAERADLLLLLTEWPEFKQFNWEQVRSKMNTPIIFDAKNALDHARIAQSGFSYYRIGAFH